MQVFAVFFVGTALVGCSPAPHARSATGPAHAPRHVFVIVLENEPFQVTFGEHSPAPYLAHELPKQGALLTQGWLGPRDAPASAEDILAHLDEIKDVAGLVIPEAPADEYRLIAERIAGGSR